MLKQIIFMFSKCRVLRHPARLKTSRSTFQNASRVLQSVTLRLAAEGKNAPCVNASQHLRREIPCGEQQLTIRLNIEPSRENPDTASPHAQHSSFICMLWLAGKFDYIGDIFSCFLNIIFFATGKKTGFL